jgi:L-ascorbate metabolism protein UlaG (beta-lactamase superfamily)
LPRFWALVRLCGAFTLALLASSCSSTNPYFDPGKPHHRPDGFVNRFAPEGPPGQGSFWRWQWERLWAAQAPDEPGRVARATPDLAYLRANRQDLTATWIGHSTVLWQVQGLNVITDPHFGHRASPVGFAGPKRHVPLPMTLSELPRIDVVLISHNHYDHLDRDSVLALNAQPGGPPLFVVPLGVDLWMQQEGITRVQRMDWGDRHAIARPGFPGEAVTVEFVPVQHWSSRTPWDRNATLWGGYVVSASVGGKPYRLFFAGDTGYSADFKALGEQFGGFDFSAIPVGCYEPRWFMRSQHVNEDDAVRIHQDVKSRHSMGIHWGSFRLCDESPLDGLPKARAKYGVADDAFVLFQLGETRVLNRAAP